MRAAASWAANHHERTVHTGVSHNRASGSSPSSKLSVAAHAHHTLPVDDTHRAKELAMLLVLLEAKLM